MNEHESRWKWNTRVERDRESIQESAHTDHACCVDPYPSPGRGQCADNGSEARHVRQRDIVQSRRPQHFSSGSESNSDVALALHPPRLKWRRAGLTQPRAWITRTTPCSSGLPGPDRRRALAARARSAFVCGLHVRTRRGAREAFRASLRH